MSKFTDRLKYADITSLETYQSMIMLFVNPFQLLEASHSHNDSVYILNCATASVLIGIFTIFAIHKDCLGEKKLAAQMHLVLCVVIMCLLIKDLSENPLTELSFYSCQLICSIFCYWRISSECFIRRKK